MKIHKILILVFALFVVIFSVIIYNIFSINSSDFFEKSFKVTIKEINPVRGKPNQRTAKLSNDSSISVPGEFIPYIQVGDSLLKESKSTKITLKSLSLNKTFVTSD